MKISQLTTNFIFKRLSHKKSQKRKLAVLVVVNNTRDVSQTKLPHLMDLIVGLIPTTDYLLCHK